MTFIIDSLCRSCSSNDSRYLLITCSDEAIPICEHCRADLDRTCVSLGIEDFDEIIENDLDEL